MSQRTGKTEPNFLSLTTKFCDGNMNTKWVEKLSQNSASVASPSVSYGYCNSEPNPLSLSTGFCDGDFPEKSKKWVGKSSKSSASVASPPASHEHRNSEPDPLSLSSGIPDGSIAEKKKKKMMNKKRVGKSSQSSGGGVASPSVSHGNEVSEASTVHISKKLLSPDHTQNSLSVGMQSSDDCSKISKQGSAELSSTSVVEDVVVQCNKQVELEDSNNRSHTGCTYNGKENRHFGWNRRQYNAREGHVNWGKKPSYRNGVKNVNPAENHFAAERSSLANDGILPSPLISSGYNNGKENRHIGWNRKQHNAREGHVNWGKKPSYRNGVKDVNLAENRFWSERNLLANDAISPTPSNSSGHKNAAYGYRKRDAPPRLLNESSQGAASPQRLNGTLFVSVKSQTEGLESDSEKLVGRSPNSIKPVNCNMKKGPRNYEAVFSELHGKCKQLSIGCFNMHDYKRDDAGTNGKQIASHGDRHYLTSPSMYSKMSTQGVMNGIQQHKFRKIPSMEHEFGKLVHVSLDGIPCFHTDHKLEKDTSGANIMERTAVGTKEFRPVDRISSASISNEFNLLPDLSRELNNSHLRGNTISCNQLISYDDPKVYQSAAEIGKKLERKGYDAKNRGPKDPDQFLIGSNMGMKALNAAYQMQLASETVQLTMGSPLAEFETFIHCAVPVIPSSSVHKEYSVSLGTQPSHGLLSKHQIPNVSLHSVWNWYEIPGNYGLDVKAVCPKTLTGLPNDSMSFQAYFVPSLSAIQLFGPHIPGCERSFSNSSEAVHLNHIRVGSFDVALHDGSCVQSLDCSPVFSSDAELIFEFFEVELPHHRRPFYNKILELIGAGTSNPQVFGDPSKLTSLNLPDLHPASWFSVAWYPIYQIPEGHLRASFLTYHSLGHFVQRPGSTVAPGCIFFPVLGLQSYNSQDECWFEPKIPSSEPTSFDTTGILIKRLRTLDENALHFARGWVYKDKVMVQNRHPDYEFFTSRLGETKDQIERILGLAFENYKSLDESSLSGIMEVFRPATGRAAPALEPAVKLFTLLHDVLSPEVQTALCHYFQVAARKRSRRHLTETDEYTTNNSEGILMDPLTIATAYQKMKSLCLNIRNEIRTDIEIHNQHILPSFIDLPHLAASIYSTELCARLRAFLIACPPSGPSPPVAELVIATADFQRDLASWNISHIKAGVDAKELFHLYIMLWIQDKRQSLLEVCKLDKVKWSGVKTRHSTTPFVDEMYERLRGTLTDYEVIICRWPEYTLVLENAIADVEKAIVESLDKQYADVLAPLKENMGPKKFGLKYVQKLAKRSVCSYTVPEELGILLNSLKRMLDVLRPQIEVQFRSWASCMPDGGPSAPGERLSEVTVMLRAKFRNYLQAVVEKLAENTKLQSATKLKKILQDSKETVVESDVRSRMQPLKEQLTSTINHLHTGLETHVFIAVCRGYWDRMGQDVLSFLENRKENRSWYKGSRVAVSVLDDTFASQMQQLLGNALLEKDLEAPRCIMEVRSMLCKDAAHQKDNSYYF